MDNAISLPGSACGRTPSVATTGENAIAFGRALAPANLSARQASSLGLTTSGTYGPLGSISLRSDALQSSLASRLAARSRGSILYATTWKARATPSGRQICALRASPWKIGTKARSTNGFYGPYTIVPTPWLPQNYLILPLSLAETLARMTATISGSDSILSGWPTPRTVTGGAESAERKKELGRVNSGGGDLQAAALIAGWPSPTVGNATGSQAAKDASATGRRPDGTKATVALNPVAHLAAWPTPATRDHKDGAAPSVIASGRTDKLPHAVHLAGPMRLTAEGVLLIGCSAGMESGGQLDPAHSRWLMRLPPEWDDCAPTAMRSTRKRSSPS